ncbi:ABC transporter ATP-binding protein [Paenibacillus sp. tmac-D7]|uniref:oligopeptide/dipeptide ABC transporter ATP-binding protein n=1 Tax=Paenibacillus sp. tmac-D7 TaxID=2591462 RepID=UPI0011429E74|nr:ABC transporter ATP-binding protein [Paenibacillus sp. tmac-D7]
MEPAVQREQPLLEVIDVSKSFSVPGKSKNGEKIRVTAADKIHLTIHKGETLGLVGESGSGKSTLARLILRLGDADTGTIRFMRTEIQRYTAKQMRPFRKDIQIIFQDPYSSLNPQMTVADNICFNLWVHGEGKHAESRMRKILQDVGLTMKQSQQYPFELSGGQRQRVNIARALILNPKLVIADEPVSALDKSIQAQVLNLLQDLKEEYRLSYLFISHDLNVVEYMSDRVAVMYFGRIVELTDSDTLYSGAKHPYTQLLLNSIPALEGKLAAEDSGLMEQANYVKRCAFLLRCPKAGPRCQVESPSYISTEAGHDVCCHLYTGGVE